MKIFVRPILSFVPLLDQVHRIYLNELGDIRTLPIWVALMVLTTVDESQAPAEARYLLQKILIWFVWLEYGGDRFG